MGGAAAEKSPELPSYQLEPVVAGDTPLYSHHYPSASLLICRVVVSHLHLASVSKATSH